MTQQRSLTMVQPAGMISMFGNTSAPAGWLKCNGQAVSRTTYSDLFDAIGTVYGAGDGSTTFNLPDLRGEFLRGWDDARGVDSGRAIGTFQSAGIDSGSTSVSIPLDASWPVGGTTYNAPGRIASPYNGAEGHAVVYYLDGTRTVSGTVSVTNPKPRNRAFLVCIKY